VPKSLDDRSVAAFSDLGAWFGFALPNEERPDLAGAFVGPLLFDEGVWASEALLRPVVTLDGEKVDLAAAKASYNAPPGRLLQMFDADGVRLSFNLHYEYESRAVIHVQVRNSSSASRSLRIEWTVDNDALAATDLDVNTPVFDKLVGARETHFAVASIALDAQALPLESLLEQDFDWRARGSSANGPRAESADDAREQLAQPARQPGA